MPGSFPALFHPQTAKSAFTTLSPLTQQVKPLHSPGFDPHVLVVNYAQGKRQHRCPKSGLSHISLHTSLPSFLIHRAPLMTSFLCSEAFPSSPSFEPKNIFISPALMDHSKASITVSGVLQPFLSAVVYIWDFQLHNSSFMKTSLPHTWVELVA